MEHQLVATRPDYTANDPKGWCGDPRRGAALGRSDRKGKYDGSKLTLRKVQLDNGGYDRLGTYWGHGEPLYWCASDDGEIDFCFRVEVPRMVQPFLAKMPSAKVIRHYAKQEVKSIYPNARFFR